MFTPNEVNLLSQEQLAKLPQVPYRTGNFRRGSKSLPAQSRLTPLYRVAKERKREWWLCKCACGKLKVIRRDALFKSKGPTLSCGCFTRERSSIAMRALLADSQFHEHRNACIRSSEAHKQSGREKLAAVNRQKRLKVGANPDQILTPRIMRLRHIISRLTPYILRRDNFTCAICGKRGGDLQVHHVKRFNKNPEIGCDPFNMITLCVNCHKNTVHINEESWSSLLQGIAMTSGFIECEEFFSIINDYQAILEEVA